MSVGAMKDLPTRLTYTVLHGGMGHQKIETRLIDEMFASVMGKCVILES